jgi:hypothetical protein
MDSSTPSGAGPMNGSAKTRSLAGSENSGVVRKPAAELGNGHRLFAAHHVALFGAGLE